MEYDGHGFLFVNDAETSNVHAQHECLTPRRKEDRGALSLIARASGGPQYPFFENTMAVPNYNPTLARNGIIQPGHSEPMKERYHSLK